MQQKLWLHISSLVVVVVVSVSCSLDEVLEQYEVLNKDDITHRTIRRRSIDLADRHLDFTSHGQRFHMKLYPSQEIVDPLFRVLAVDGGGREEEADVDVTTIYKGIII